MRKEVLVIIGVVGGSLLLMGGLTALGTRPKKPIADVTQACVQHGGVGMHIHPHLKIRIDGDDRKISAGIGISPACMRPIHTHDDSGEIHLEFPVEQEVRLGQFFGVWKQPLSRTQVLDRAVVEGDTLRVTVNGKDVQELENLVMRDKEEIVIELKKGE